MRTGPKNALGLKSGGYQWTCRTMQDCRVTYLAIALRGVTCSLFRLAYLHHGACDTAHCDGRSHGIGGDAIFVTRVCKCTHQTVRRQVLVGHKEMYREGVLAVNVRTLGKGQRLYTFATKRK